MYSSRCAGLVLWNIIQKRSIYRGVSGALSFLCCAPARGHAAVEVTKLLLVGERVFSLIMRSICSFFWPTVMDCLFFRA